MTLAEIRQSTRDVLLLKDIAPVLGLNPQTLRSQAQADPSKLGFPVTVAGSSTRIPRIPFIKYMDGELPLGRTEIVINGVPDTGAKK